MRGSRSYVAYRAQRVRAAARLDAESGGSIGATGLFDRILVTRSTSDVDGSI